MTKKGYMGIIKVLVCMLISFICITFTSKNSFLFAYQDSRDIQIFLTTVRGILDGDVLYRDIFEVKGPYLYVIYTLGAMISEETLWGVYLIEVFLFSIYMYLSYKIANLYVKSVPLCFLITAITGFLSTTTLTMDCGGQAEELLLPVFSLIIYVTIKYFKEIYPKRIPAPKVLLVAICFTLIFWVKYTLVGLILGLILYLIIIQIQDKTLQNIPYYAGLFVVGIILGTLPIAVYFTYHNAWASLWDAYFYKLLFEYKTSKINLHGFGTKLFFEDYIATTCFTAYAFIFSLVSMVRNSKGNRHHYGSIFAMILFQATGLSFSRNWLYTAECMHTFNALGLSMFILTIATAIGLMRENSKTLMKILEGNKSICNNAFILLMTAVGILLFVNRAYFILPILYVCVFGIILWIYLKNEKKVEHIIQNWKEEYREKRNTINVLVSILSVIILAAYTYSFSKTSFAIGVPLERYPQYKISQYILKSGVENPILINYQTTDAGIYGLTNTAPPTKWVGDYNANFAEVETMYEEYVDGQKADFLITESGSLELDGYKLVLSPGETDYINEGRKLELFLYGREN